MKRAQLIGMSIAGVAGIMAFVMVKGIVNKPQPQKQVAVQVNATEVLVARADIGLGQIATEKDFKWQTWPADALTPTFITKAQGTAVMRELSGAIARAPIIAGEPITAYKLIKPGQGGVLAAILPAGMRAISTKIKEETSVGRLILPNDHVDVILIRRLRTKGGGEEHVSDTLFRNVRVLALGQQIESKEGKKSTEGSANTATLELTPKQSELLALAASMGELSLALRSVADLAGESGPSGGNDLNKQRGNAIRILRYGARSRAYGVN
ncbi:MAG: Flp pilus assembly protein CpaB [Hyphomicrobium sp.]|nr:Flp pilus assembly protein CpaB [Hyphomicrobium sp.]PPC81554.1 MAG: Flp pilus assembly protein CpaB [Hyphomicrobium sp.]